MKKTIFMIAILILLSSLAVYAESTDSTDSSYIPKNLDECFVELQKVLTPEQLAEFKSKKEDEIGEYHFSIGRWMRNFWHLWGKSKLTEYFNNIGIYHPDDMSGIILISFHRYLHNKDIKLEEQIKYYQDYWAKFKKEELANKMDLEEGKDYIVDENGLKYDAKEYDPKYENVMKDVDEEINKIMPDQQHMGYCHMYWREKKRILKEKYGIDWKSPAELNPHIIFD